MGWEDPTIGPNNFKVKPKLNKNMKVRMGKEALKLADWVMIEPDGGKINKCIHTNAMEKRKKL